MRERKRAGEASPPSVKSACYNLHGTFLIVGFKAEIGAQSHTAILLLPQDVCLTVSDTQQSCDPLIAGKALYYPNIKPWRS